MGLCMVGEEGLYEGSLRHCVKRRREEKWEKSGVGKLLPEGQIQPFTSFALKFDS